MTLFNPLSLFEKIKILGEKKMIKQIKNETEINSFGDLSRFIMETITKQGETPEEIFPKIFEDSFVERDLNRFIAKKGFFDPEFFQSSLLHYAKNVAGIDLEALNDGVDVTYDFIYNQIINKLLSQSQGDFYSYPIISETGLENTYTIRIVEFM